MTAPRGFQGYNHRGRLIEPGPVAGTWIVELINLAPGLGLGPVQSTVPDLTQGDTVLLAQVGTTRDDLVIVGRLPGQAPDISTITGLSAALDALESGKADQTDLDALNTRVGADEEQIATNAAAIVTNAGSIATNAAAISANSTAITTLQGRAADDEADIAANTTAIATLPVGIGNDMSINRDQMRTLPRSLASTALALANGRAFYARMRTDRAITVRLIKYCIATTGVGGTLALAAWSGPTLSALTFRGSTSSPLIGNRHDWFVSPFVMAPGDDLVVAFLGLANTTVPALSASPAVNVTLLDQDAATMTSVESAATVAALPTGDLDFSTTTGMVLLGQMPWLAASS